MRGETAKVAFFWDKSFLWGLIAYDTFREMSIRFDLLTSADIRGDRLNGYDVLFVPGGWASDKISALGDEGRERIRDFISGGGSYLGICGGAGLALSHESGLGLARVSRMPTHSRLPSFSGSVRLKPAAAEHPMWKEFPDGADFHAWWPGQFSLEGAGEIQVLAVYGPPGTDAYVTDLPALPGMDWDFWEQRYGINLNPQRIVGEPAVIETRFGDGKVLLSYLHFETPGDTAGHAVLLNILDYLAGGKRIAGPATAPKYSTGSVRRTEAVRLAEGLKDSADALIDYGRKNFLWYDRNDWILQWRRGVRGVEYSTLHAILTKLAVLVAQSGRLNDETATRLRHLRDISKPFFSSVRELLKLERDAMKRGPISPLKTDEEQISAMREILFSNTKRCGGLYEEIIELADDILLPLLRRDRELFRGHNT